MYSWICRGHPATTAHHATLELEAVARAMCLAFNLDWRGGAPEDWSAVVESEWPDFLLEARAALETLRVLSGGQLSQSFLDRVLDSRTKTVGRAEHADRAPPTISAVG